MTETYRLHVRPHFSFTPNLFLQKGLHEFVKYFSAKELSLLVSILTETQKYGFHPNPILESKVSAHTLEVLGSHQIIADAHTDPGKLHEHLKKRGNPDIVGESGISASTPYFIELNRLARELKSDQPFYRAFLAAVLLHDIGNFVAQENHPSLTRRIIHESGEIRRVLEKLFLQKEIEWVEEIAGNHSALPDSIILKEESPAIALYDILSSSDNYPLQEKFAKAALLMAVNDINAYNRLTDRKIKDLFDMYDKLIIIIQSKRKVSSPQDLEEGDLSPSNFGRIRFEAWSVKEETPREAEELELAYQELERFFPTKEIQQAFLKALGTHKRINLFFNMRREMTDPRLRVRLMIWTVNILQQYEKEIDWIEFNYLRFNPEAKPKAIAHLNWVLTDVPIEKISEHFNLRLDQEQRGLVIDVSGV